MKPVRLPTMAALIGLMVVLACVPAMAQVVTQLTHTLGDDSTLWLSGKIVADGSIAYIETSTDRHGSNPDHSWQIFRVDLATGNGTLVRLIPDGVYSVSVDDAGEWLAFHSKGDPLGTNHDQSSELFVMRTDGSELAQLTDVPKTGLGSMGMPKISGDGSTIIFRSDIDFDGSNPNHDSEIWVIKRDGSGLSRLTYTDGDVEGISQDISNDGSKVVFLSHKDLVGGNPDGSAEVFAVNSDGTGLRQLTSGTLGARNAVLSGNGSTVALSTSDDLVPPGNPVGIPEVYAMNWDGTGVTQLTEGLMVADYPGVTDDGQTIFYISNNQIFSSHRDGSGKHQLTHSPNETTWVVVDPAGSGSRLLMSYFSNPPTWGHDPDRSGEICSMDGDGSNPRQLTDNNRQDNENPDISGDGAVVVFQSQADLTGGNPSWTRQIFSMGSDGSSLRQLTSHSGGSTDPAISGDGATIVFASTGDPLGSNLDRESEIFAIDGDGTNLRQLTSSVGSSREPSISQDGSLVAFTSVGDLDGAEGSGDTPDVFVIHPDGTGLHRVTTGASDFPNRDLLPELDRTGTWVVFHTEGDLVGSNPDLKLQVYRARTDGSDLEQITGISDSGRSYQASISGDGRWVAYSSTGDPLGTNADGNWEIFLYDTQTATVSQVTDSTEGSSLGSSISDDGKWLFFSSSSPLLDPGLLRQDGTYRASIPGLEIDRVSGLGIWVLSASRAGSSSDGNLAVWASKGSEDDSNPDLNLEIVLADQLIPAKIYVSPAESTVVSWDVETGPVRYDVIRGDVADLSASGLGPVVCLEDDSPDADTIGDEDTVDPAPGQIFYYLYRGTEGEAAGPGSYGTASDGAERQPGQGGCADN